MRLMKIRNGEKRNKLICRKLYQNFYKCQSPNQSPLIVRGTIKYKEYYIFSAVFDSSLYCLTWSVRHDFLLQSGFCEQKLSPTKHFATSEPQNQPNDLSVLHRICRSTYFEALAWTVHCSGRLRDGIFSIDNWPNPWLLELSDRKIIQSLFPKLLSPKNIKRQCFTLQDVYLEVKGFNLQHS